MNTDNKDLLSVLDIEKWQALQDALAVVTGMAIITVDYKGVPVTVHSGCSAFCKRVREVPALNMACQKCDSRGGLEATRQQKPYIYLCHAGILDAAIPIIVKNHYLGAIMIGQALLADADEASELELVCTPGKELLERELGADAQLAEELPRLSLGRVKTIVDMLFHLCNYIVEGIVEKNLVLDMFANTLPTPGLQGDLAGDQMNPVLKPALHYINTRKGERCTISQMAALCHISPSYFSKLFLREMGENYSAYLLRTRIKWAKELLMTTDKHINEIAVTAGFSDAGHFIRNFKKSEGTTPARFRQLLK